MLAEFVTISGCRGDVGDGQYHATEDERCKNMVDDFPTLEIGVDCMVGPHHQIYP
jgi:hypothetical protein